MCDCGVMLMLMLVFWEVGCGPVVMVESQRRPGKRESFAEKRALQDLAGEEICCYL